MSNLRLLLPESLLATLGLVVASPSENATQMSTPAAESQARWYSALAR